MIKVGQVRKLAHKWEKRAAELDAKLLTPASVKERAISKTCREHAKELRHEQNHSDNRKREHH